MSKEIVIYNFLRGQNKKIKNDESKDYSLYFHGNKIAEFNLDGHLYITNCGYNTKSTKERLNILGAQIHQKKGIWYKNNIEWDGKWIKI